MFKPKEVITEKAQMQTKAKIWGNHLYQWGQAQECTVTDEKRELERIYWFSLRGTMAVGEVIWSDSILLRRRQSVSKRYKGRVRSRERLREKEERAERKSISTDFSLYVLYSSFSPCPGYQWTFYFASCFSVSKL